MAIVILLLLLIAYIVIRTVAFAIYCVKETGWLSGMSVFALALATAAAGYVIVFGNTGIG